jgi:hypothetical protein
MDDGLLHLGSMAVLVGIVYLNLDKLSAHSNLFTTELKRICIDVALQVVRKDAPVDKLPLFARNLISQKLGRITEAGSQVCAFPCEVALHRPGLFQQIASLADALRELRRTHFLRHVGSSVGGTMLLQQPQYQLGIAFWFQVDSVCKAPALRTILKKRDQLIIGILTTLSGISFCCEIGGRVFDIDLPEFISGPWYAKFQFVLYVGTILAIVLFAFFARVLRGDARRDMFPRCTRYLAQMKALNDEEDEQSVSRDILTGEEFKASGI